MKMERVDTRRRIFVTIIFVVSLSSLWVLAIPSSATDTDNIETFEHNLMFGFEYDWSYVCQSWVWEDPLWGKVTITGYATPFPFDKHRLRLPVKLQAKYDTTLAYLNTEGLIQEENIVQMAAIPYNGEGKEVEYANGLNFSITWENALGQVSFGDFDTGWYGEGDFTPPLGSGEIAYISGDDFTVNIGLWKLIALDISAEFQTKVEGKYIKGDIVKENDPSTDFYPVDPANDVKITSSNSFSNQFSIKQQRAPHDGVHLDPYCDFRIPEYSLKYKLKYTSQIRFRIGFSFALVSVDWPFTPWADIASCEEEYSVMSDDSDEPAYQMSRSIGDLKEITGCIDHYDIPIFMVGPISPIKEIPSALKTVVVPIRKIWVTPPPIYSIQNTSLAIYYGNGTWIKNVTITSSDFDTGSITTVIRMPEVSEQPYNNRSNHQIDFLLYPPVITNLPGNYSYIDGTYFPHPPVKVTLCYHRKTPELQVENLLFSVYKPYIYKVQVRIRNIGDGTSSPIPLGIKLRVYEGWDTTIDKVTIRNAPVVYLGSLRALNPGECQEVSLNWIGHQDLDYVAFTVEIVSVTRREKCQENNKPFTTEMVREGEEYVGGIVVPIDKFGLLAPYIGLASTIVVAAVATAIYVKRVKRRMEKQ